MTDSKKLDAAIIAAQKAGEYLAENFLKDHTILAKTDSTTLLNRDLHSQEIIIEYLKKRFPEDAFLSEENDETGSRESVFIIDPLCGTFSYLRGVETWSVTIGYVSEGRLEFGVVVYPLLGYLFVGEAHKGSTLNGKPIRVSATTDLKKAYISVEHNVFLDGKYDIRRLIGDIKRIRVGHGSGAELSYVGAGILDAVIKTDQSPEHYSGGRCIVEAGGGVFIGFDGKPLPVITQKNKRVNYIATNSFLADILVKYSFLNSNNYEKPGRS